MSKDFRRWMCIASAGAVLAMLATAPGAGAQADATALKDHLVDASKQNTGDLAKAVDALVARAHAAETANHRRVAADDFAVAVMKSTNFAQRDSLRAQVRAALQKELGGDAAATPQLDSAVAQTLDRAFQTAFDHNIHVTPAKPSASGRTVLAEYITGIQCAPCWYHDRLYAALLQRYQQQTNTHFVVLAYHDGPGYPIAHDGDQLWGHIASAGDGGPGLYSVQTVLAAGDIGWVDGQPLTYDLSTITDKSELPAVEAKMYAMLASAIDKDLRRPPGANVSLTVTPAGGSDTALDSVTVHVHVVAHVGTRHLGVRLALVEDTVRVTGFTNRRLQYAAVRTVAWFAPQHRTKDLFFQLQKGTDSATVPYTFNVADLQRSLWKTYESEEWARTGFPDRESWRIHPRRLGVVAIVQDLKTREVLQTAYQRVLPGMP